MICEITTITIDEHSDFKYIVFAMLCSTLCRNLILFIY